MKRKQMTSILLILIGLIFVVLYFFKDSLQPQKSGLINSKTSTLKTKDSLLKPKKTKPILNTVLFGIDISKYNKNIVDEINHLDKLTFIICKATEGMDYIDPTFFSNWKSLKNKNIIRGTYHFYKDNDDPIIQAQHFLTVVKKWETYDITPIIDIEMLSLSTHNNIEKLQENILIFLGYVENHTKRIPMIYTNYNFANQYLSNKKISKYPLWLAEYTSKDYPIIPNTWKNKGFKIWQKSDSYHYKSSIDDFDVFYGEKSDLYN
jgi:GH25 family lysozyme M1 (1,4-beta-N-acetylmuramidase)